jgi:hypothetical protein
MIELAIVLVGVGWVSGMVRNRNIKRLDSEAQAGFDLFSYEPVNDDPADVRPINMVTNDPLSMDTFTGGSVCGDGVTDQTISKKVVFRADRGTVVQGLKICISICEDKILEWNLSETPNSRGGVLTRQTDYSAVLNAGNYTVTIYNYNSTDMPNDGNLTDDQISIMIDGFAIGVLPMTLSNDSETYPMIVNPD